MSGPRLLRCLPLPIRPSTTFRSHLYLDPTHDHAAFSTQPRRLRPCRRHGASARGRLCCHSIPSAQADILTALLSPLLALLGRLPDILQHLQHHSPAALPFLPQQQRFALLFWRRPRRLWRRRLLRFENGGMMRMRFRVGMHFRRPLRRALALRCHRSQKGTAPQKRPRGRRHFKATRHFPSTTLAGLASVGLRPPQQRRSHARRI